MQTRVQCSPGNNAPAIARRSGTSLYCALPIWFAQSLTSGGGPSSVATRLLEEVQLARSNKAHQNTRHNKQEVSEKSQSLERQTPSRVLNIQRLLENHVSLQKGSVSQGPRRPEFNPGTHKERTDAHSCLTITLTIPKQTSVETRKKRHVPCYMSFSVSTPVPLLSETEFSL